MLSLPELIVLVLILATMVALGRLVAPLVTQTFDYSRTGRLDRYYKKIEEPILRFIGADPNHSMGWKEYFVAVVVVNSVQAVFASFFLLFQGQLPLNPQGFPDIRWDLAFNTVVSITTNTNLQHYNGENSLSYLSQMMGIVFLQFTSAATGLSVGIAVVRGFVKGARSMGNFYVDFVRAMTRILIPLCFVTGLVLVALGVPQTLGGYLHVRTLSGALQTIKVGPVASLVPIMQYGTNGGGYFGANSAFPFQNPSQVTDILEILMMALFGTSLPFVYGQMIGKNKEGRTILLASYGLFVIDLAIAFIPQTSLGEGMETRFGSFMSVFWTVTTTAFTTGSVNAALAAFHPLVILAGFLGMLIQATPGGKGVGLMYMLMFTVITVFIVGLMAGRTPEYLGLKVNARDVKLAVIAFLTHPVIILVPTVLAFSIGAAQAIGLGNNANGFTQVLWEFTSAAANNGSDFIGSGAQTSYFFNISTAFVMFAGRFIPIGVMLALSASMVGRKRSVEGGLKTDGLLFTAVLIGSILILTVLTFFPFLALGPILSFLQGNTNGF
ncbi:MAG TPA: potassium-transporting ATPase subunit KdpA [Nitrososphaerales archaeon]|nr:potassium-transporting ATPase subunit KdpA [Nitrososphaerales archaeon]